MFVTTIVALHVIKPSRGKAVVTEMFGEIRPQVWVSDKPGSQCGNAVACAMSSRVTPFSTPIVATCRA